MPKCIWRRRLSAAWGAALAAGALVPATAAATPTGLVNCQGTLAKAKATVDDANLTGYAFSCNGDIQSYSVIVNRQLNDFSTLDDFSPSASVLDATKKIPSSTQAVSCEGIVPGNGVNCFAGGSATPAVVSAGQWIEGTFDTTDPFCGKPAKNAKSVAEPQALVQLVVTDVTGAQWGPFRLSLKPACPAVHKTKAKPKKKAKKHAVKKHADKKAAKQATRR